jgi:hypothetical protein
MMLRKTALVSVVSAVLLVLAGCPQHKSIADVMKDPARYSSQDVTVVGTVTESFGALGTGVYEIDDGTGKMWVFAQNTGVPSKGTKVATQGRIQPTVTFGGRSFATVLREKERHGR